MIGVVDHHTLQVERPDEVAALIREALKSIPPERLLISSDCGMGREGMSRRHATYKMVAMVLGTNIVRKELGLPEAECLAADPRYSRPHSLSTEAARSTSLRSEGPQGSGTTTVDLRRSSGGHMDLGKYGHLTYSTLVHPGDTWPQMWESLTTFVPRVKKQNIAERPLRRITATVGIIRRHTGQLCSGKEQAQRLPGIK